MPSPARPRAPARLPRWAALAPMVALALLLGPWAGAAEPAAAPAPDEAAKPCDACDAWNADRAPFRLFGRAWYVGPEGLSVVVVDTGEGLVLLDGGLPQSVAGIVERLAGLGLRIEDVRWILVSHAHYDHAGGVAALQRRSGATVATTAAGAAALRSGGDDPADPQAGWGAEAMRFPPVTGTIRVVGEGDRIALGAVTFWAHPTPGHTAGGLTWTWEACEPATAEAADPRCAAMVYADSLNAVAAPGFRFLDDPARVTAFEASIAAVAALPCDVLVSVHPGFSRLHERAARALAAGKPDPLVDPGACRAYAAGARRGLAARLRQERREAPAGP